VRVRVRGLGLGLGLGLVTGDTATPIEIKKGEG
jgi:hypothetical protein